MRIKGSKLTEEHKKKIGEANKGKKRTDEHKKNYSKSKLMENNPMWAYDDVGYYALHEWVRSHFWKTRLCQMCMLVPPYDLANITGVYNREFKNWRYYCRKCHMESDDRLLTMIERNYRKDYNYNPNHDPKTGRYMSSCAVV